MYGDLRKRLTRERTAGPTRIGQDRGMDASCQRSSSTIASWFRPRLFEQPRPSAPSPVATSFSAIPSRNERIRPLLRTVMEVALEATTLLVARLDDTVT